MRSRLETSFRVAAVAGACLLLAAVALRPAPKAAAADPEAGRPLLVTVDDLPLAGRLHARLAERERITAEMLAVLAEHRVPAVGLVTWGNVGGAADLALLDRWLAAGHELGNHTESHLDYNRREPADYLADVEAARAALAAFLADGGRKPPRFFRFPMLHEGDTEAKLDAARAYLADSGQVNLPVTLDNPDWNCEAPWVEARRRGDAAGMARIAEEYHEAMHLAIRHHEATGDRLFGRPVPQILLLHAGAVGAAQWDRLFAWLAARGYRFAAADEVLVDPAFATPPRYVGRPGLGLWDRLLDGRRRQQARAEVAALLAEQAAAWGRGDLEAFTAVYAADAAFVSPSGLTRGRAEVLARYRRRYPDRAAMGRLTLEVIESRPAAGVETSMIGDARPGDVDAVSVVARWTLSFPDDPGRDEATGLTLLVLHRRSVGGGGWEIVQDASM